MFAIRGLSLSKSISETMFQGNDLNKNREKIDVN